MDIMALQISIPSPHPHIPSYTLPDAAEFPSPAPVPSPATACTATLARQNANSQNGEFRSRFLVGRLGPPRGSQRCRPRACWGAGSAGVVVVEVGTRMVTQTSGPALAGGLKRGRRLGWRAGLHGPRGWSHVAGWGQVKYLLQRGNSTL